MKFCTCSKAAMPVPDLVVIAQLMCHYDIINVCSTAILKVLHMFLTQVLFRYE